MRIGYDSATAGMKAEGVQRVSNVRFADENRGADTKGKAVPLIGVS